jgi:hypothetical protein
MPPACRSKTLTPTPEVRLRRDGPPPGSAAGAICWPALPHKAANGRKIAREDFPPLDRLVAMSVVIDPKGDTRWVTGTAE